METHFVDTPMQTGQVALKIKDHVPDNSSLVGSVITWEARKQRTVALSNVEAEYLALGEATKEALYLRQMLNKRKLSQPTLAIIIYNDDQGAQQSAENSVHHTRTKRIDVRHHFIRDHVKNSKIELKYIFTDLMTADVLAKALPRVEHQKLTSKLGI